MTSSERALQYLYLNILIPASQPLYISNKVLASEVALQFRALQFLAGKSNLPVTSSQRALQYLYLIILMTASQPLYMSNKGLASEVAL